MPIPAPLPDLPVGESLPALRAALAEHRRAVLVAPPGAGKTTIVPLALVDEPWLGGRRIVMLEPRRLATRAAARRMAELCGQQVGDLVGYQTRDERHLSAGTRIEVVTEGILTRRLQNDPELPGVGLVIFDEVHERNLPTDLGLAFALDAAATLRPDLADPRDVGHRRQRRARRPCWATTMPGPPRSSRARAGSTPSTSGGCRESAGTGSTTSWSAPVHAALRDEPGDLLVFLPGIGEIMRAKSALEPSVGPDVDVYPLAGALSLSEQDHALNPSPPGRRRVVLSTDIAETSLTVEGVRIIVDSGLARAPRFDTRTGMSRLTTITTSRSSAEQRAGRAGRVEPGVCYRLWSKVEHGTRSAHRTPEIDDVDLSGLVLEVAAWGTPLEDLSVPDATAPEGDSCRRTTAP